MSSLRRARLRADATNILRLSGPLLVNNLATAGMTTADTVMAGRLGALELAAVALGANYVSLFYLGGLGLLMALSPTVAHAVGAGRDREAGGYFRQALWLSLGVTTVVLAGLAFTGPVLRAIGTDPAVADLAARYVGAVAFGMPAMFAFLALRFSSEGLGWTRPILFTAVLAFAVNVSGNWVFIHGRFGMPALGAVGCGVATAITQWLIFAVLWTYVRRHRAYRPYAPLARFEGPDPRRLREILALGLPICGSVLAEGALFASAGLTMGGFGATVVAAHAIAINYAALMFMVPLSIHSATTIHVGHRAGAGRWREARDAGWTGAAICVATMAVSALVLLGARGAIAALYSEDAAVVGLAALLLLYAAAFQVADGLQVGMAGALRGFKDARVPMLLCIAAYWGLGFPLAWGLGVAAGHGAPGVWTGLIAGLFAAASMLTLRWRHVTGRAVAAGERGAIHPEKPVQHRRGGGPAAEVES
ncbi:MAG: MATE family efflux transporter [Steroidobacteraceae bacterium]|jgi:MATE family multidrug resistance protein|nr:MATE family efflux transporter [Steroidobacteraceae bacterium]